MRLLLANPKWISDNAGSAQQFAAAKVPVKIMTAYDAILDKKPELADRTSYVISPEGKILYVYTALDPEGHVDNTMSAVKTWKLSH